MKRVFLLLLLACLLFTGCELAASAETTAAPETTLPETTTVPETTALPETEAPETQPPETVPPDAGLTGTALAIPAELTLTAAAPQARLRVEVARTDLSGVPQGRVCLLTLRDENGAAAEEKHIRVLPGAAEELEVSVPFSRYMDTADRHWTVTLQYRDETLTYGLTVKLENDPDEVWAVKTGDPYPYLIRVYRNFNTVVVFGKDDAGAYTVPVKTYLCSTGPGTPHGTYRMYGKAEWHYLFGNVYGQYTEVIDGDILFHSVPYRAMTKDSLKTEEFNKLGTTCSMGCIRMTVGACKWIYDFCPDYTTVEIYDYDELPVELPTAPYIDPADPRAGWDPTDPDPANPWRE